MPIAIKIWGERDANSKISNDDFHEQLHTANNASLAAVMPPPVTTKRLGDIFPDRQCKDADGNTILTP